MIPSERPEKGFFPDDRNIESKLNGTGALTFSHEI